MRDIGFQILNRTHNERLYSGQWSQDTTDFYEKQSVLNPGFAPKNPVSVRFEVIGRTLSRHLSFYFIGNRPAWSWRFGAQGKLVFVALVFLVIGFVAPQPPPTGDRSPGIPHAGRIALLSGMSALIVVIFLMPTYFTQWFPTFRLPLFLAATFATLAAGALRQWLGGRTAGLALFTLLLFTLSALPAAREKAEQLALDHPAFCRELKSRVSYCNFTPASISSFTRTTTCGPTTAGFLKLAATGRLDQPGDLLFCVDRRENSANFVPDTVIFFNWADPAPRDAIEKSPHFRKKAEGQTFVAFERI